MTDCHHHHHHNDEKNARRLIWAFGVIAVFMVVEVVGGLISSSLALLADATHMFADSVALGLAASANLIARRPADSKRHFGYRRAQVLAAFFNGATLTVLMLWIVVEAVQRFFNPVEVQANLMIGVALAGFVANGFAFALLHSGGSKDLNMRGALLHVMGDMLSSLAAIIAAALIMATSRMWFDPLLSIFVALMIGVSAFRLLKETGHILLEGAPKGIDIEALSAGVKKFAPEVEDVHDVRIWQITPEDASLTLHARVASSHDAEAVLERIKNYLESAYGIRQSTVQIEIGEECPDGDDHAHEPSHTHHASAAAGHAHHHRGESEGLGVPAPAALGHADPAPAFAGSQK